MAGTGPNVNPNGDQQIHLDDNAQIQGGYINHLREASDWLQDQNKILLGFDHHRNYRRYVDLNLPRIFHALVTRYTNIFTTHKHQLDRLTRGQPLPGAYVNRESQYLAAVYISTWIYDLYAANRRATFKVSPEAYSEHYHMDIATRLDTYDPFLTVLQASIRPTVIHFTHETTLFVPRFGDFNPNADDFNYFNIEGWVINDNILHGMIQICRERKLMKFEVAIETGFGRPSWLFDYQTSTDHLYSWFPVENNFDMRDVALAYIVGVACTPKLGPLDRDEWQQFPNNILPQNINVANYRRVTPVVYHGATEVHTIETQRYRIPTGYLLQCRVSERRQRVQQPTGPSQLPPQPTAMATRAAGKKKAKVTKATGKTGPSAASTQLDESSFSLAQTEDEEDEGVEVNQTAPPTDPQPTNVPEFEYVNVDMNNYRINVAAVNRYRIVTYIYVHDITTREDDHTRMAALRMILRP